MTKITEDTKKVLESASSTVSALSVGGIDTGDLRQKIIAAQKAIRCLSPAPEAKTTSDSHNGPGWRPGVEPNTAPPKVSR